MEETQLWNLYENLKNSFVDDKDSTSHREGEVITCINCKSESLVSKDGVTVCKECGVTNGSVIEYGSEWRYYGGDDNRAKSNPSRCGGAINPLLKSMSYRTFIAGNGNEFFRKCHIWNNSEYKDTRMLEVFKLIDSFVTFNGIPKNIAHISNKVYHDVYPYKLIRGKNVDSEILNIVYYVAKACGIYYTNTEMVDMMNAFKEEYTKEGKWKKLEKKKFSHGGKVFVRCYYMADQKNLQQINPTTVDQYIEKYCEKLGVTELVTETKRIAKFLKVYGITNNRSFISVAIGVIYYVIKTTKSAKITKKEMEKRCGSAVSASTITKVCKDINQYQRLYYKK